MLCNFFYFVQHKNLRILLFLTIWNTPKSMKNRQRCLYGPAVFKYHNNIHKKKCTEENNKQLIAQTLKLLTVVVFIVHKKITGS